ncbi:hypothetical protein [Streptomyces sp. NBC_00239]|uniref:hypothetical protein n=1 Tax=Streptomyces sp. NBC_00239 TaxID=2903640 RepID=UPI002E2B2D65|nr:hypothetical protein [Streptomyces sp. NBC_00239]
MDHDTDTDLRRTELVQALTDPDHGMPPELSEHRDPTDARLGLVRLKASDGTTELQLRHDYFDHSAREGQAELFAAVRRRIDILKDEAPFPPGLPADA